MLLNPQFEEKLDGRYTFGRNTACAANQALTGDLFSELWHGFCCKRGEITFTAMDALVIRIGQAAELKQPDNGYVMEITANGIAVAASDVEHLRYGYFALLERITPVCTRKGEECFTVDCCRVSDAPCVRRRMVHLCIFPETDLAFVRKFIRLAAFVRYTHIVIEFWGTLRYDCLKELAWREHSYSKDELRPLMREAHELGLEVVPMLNHWGHATGSRVKTGKHVVLDQNIALAPLFSATGWEWNLTNPDVIELQRKMRQELIELCGEGEYFHIGCDEAYSASTKEDFETIVNHVNAVSAEMNAQGRRVLMWGDMLLHKDTLDAKIDNHYVLLCPNTELQQMLLDKLSRSVIIADWEYNSGIYPIETATFFVKHGFEVLCCPWENRNNVTASAEMVKKHDLLGVLHTTWHTIRTMNGMWAMVYSAALNWGKADYGTNPAYRSCDISMVLRKLDFPQGDYANCGWEKKQILD